MREISIGRENGEQVMMIIKGNLEEENAERKGKMILSGVEEYVEEENKERKEEDALISYIFKMLVRKAQNPICLNLRSEEDTSCLFSLL